MTVLNILTINLIIKLMCRCGLQALGEVLTPLPRTTVDCRLLLTPLPQLPPPGSMLLNVSSNHRPRLSVGSFPIVWLGMSFK